jgi:hypothetical protein
MLLIQADEEEEVDVMVRRPRMAVVSPERGRQSRPRAATAVARHSDDIDRRYL